MGHSLVVMRELWLAVWWGRTRVDVLVVWKDGAMGWRRDSNLAACSAACSVVRSVDY